MFKAMKPKVEIDNSWSNFRLIVIGLFVFFLVLSFVKPVAPSSDADSDDASKPVAEPKQKAARKLQIGIKKRPETCDRKSKKGDLLHIHYRVRFLDGFVVLNRRY